MFGHGPFEEFIQRNTVVIEIKFEKKHGGVTVGAFKRIISKGSQQTVTPTVERQKDAVLFL